MKVRFLNNIKTLRNQEGTNLDKRIKVTNRQCIEVGQMANRNIQLTNKSAS